MINFNQYQNDWDAICVLGPTASGKTRYAVDLAISAGSWSGGEFFHRAEILSADSRQVYKGMDIGTGKDLCDYKVEVTNPQSGEKTIIEIPYHLIDIVEAGEKYNIFEYQKDFANAYADVLSRGRIPIICGGSGLYIEAATKGYELKEVAPDEELRGNLEQKSLEELVALSRELKQKRGLKPHNESDFDSKKRVIRSIEIDLAYLDGGEVATSGGLLLPQRCKYIGINVSREVRNSRIDARLEARLQEGMIDEVKRLLENGVPAENLIYYGLEYKFVTQYLMGELTYEQMKSGLAVAIHQFAKRQMTWFRGMERKGCIIEWV